MADQRPAYRTDTDGKGCLMNSTTLAVCKEELIRCVTTYTFFLSKSKETFVHLPISFGLSHTVISRYIEPILSLQTKQSHHLVPSFSLRHSGGLIIQSHHSGRTGNDFQIYSFFQMKYLWNFPSFSSTFFPLIFPLLSLLPVSPLPLFLLPKSPPSPSEFLPRSECYFEEWMNVRHLWVCAFIRAKKSGREKNRITN